MLTRSSRSDRRRRPSPRCWRWKWTRAARSIWTIRWRSICRPLKMQRTHATLPGELKSRLAVGHDDKGNRADNYTFQVLAGAGAIKSSANDLLKYVSAQLGLAQSPLSPLMERSHVIRHMS